MIVPVSREFASAIGDAIREEACDVTRQLLAVLEAGIIASKTFIGFEKAAGVIRLPEELAGKLRNCLDATVEVFIYVGVAADTESDVMRIDVESLRDVEKVLGVIRRKQTIPFVSLPARVPLEDFIHDNVAGNQVRVRGIDLFIPGYRVHYDRFTEHLALVIEAGHVGDPVYTVSEAIAAAEKLEATLKDARVERIVYIGIRPTPCALLGGACGGENGNNGVEKGPGSIFV